MALQQLVLLLPFLLLDLSSTHAYSTPTDPPSQALTTLYRAPLPPDRDPVTDLLSVRYPFWHRQHRHSGRRLVYMFKNKQPGLGDRFRGLFTAYIAAAFTHRVLLLDWEYPFSVFDYLVPSSATKVRFHPVHDAPRNRSVFHCVSRGACPSHQLGPFLGPVDTIVLSDSALGRVHLVPMLMRRYPHLPLSEALRDVNMFPSDTRLFTRLFAAMFDPEMSLQALQKRQTGLDMPRRRFVAVHARLGEGVGETRGRFDLGDKEVMARCMAIAAVSTAKRQRVKRFYLATDTPVFFDMFEQQVVRLMPGASVMGGGENAAVHTSNCGREKGEEDERCAHAFLELLILAKGEALVGSKSGFSEVASYIGNVQDYTTVDLKECVDG